MIKSTPIIFINLSIFILVGLSACKKYPENTLWFKNPKNICPVNGYITSYKVNGIDSLDLLNSYYYKGPIPPSYAHKSLVYDVRKEIFETEKLNNRGLHCARTDFFRRSPVNCTILCGWDDKHKNITLTVAYTDEYYFAKNIFIENEHKWEVIYLDKHKKAKIKTTFDNGNTYEITFN
ncbi:MAG: hypothetical protein ACK504_01730 [Bacteroidota bacterium]